MRAPRYSSLRAMTTRHATTRATLCTMCGRRVLLVALVARAAAPSAVEAAAPTGLRGVVLAQRTPVCVEGRGCLEPASGVTLVFRRDGRVVARATTRTGGAYRVLLPRGSYRVSVATRPVANIAPPSVRVAGGLLRSLDIELDSGMQ